MKSYAQKNVRRALGMVVVVASLVVSACGSVSGAADAAASAKPAPTPTPTSQQGWRSELAKVPEPKKGCYQAVFPKLAWQQVRCVKTPAYPQPPRHGPRPETVGNRDDISAQAPTGTISAATGSFDSVTGVTSESGPIDNKGAAVANAYTLQLNTNFFTSTACAGSPNPACRGWEQYVFDNNGSRGLVYIQYWLIQYNATCPAGAGWNQFSFSGSTDIYCWKNDSMGATSVPAQPISKLSQLRLAGAVGTTGDNATMFVAGTAYKTIGDNTVDAAAWWTQAEFNVFGDGGSGEASFNNGAAVTARTQITYGGKAAPTCVAQGFTGETNNLGFPPTAPAASQPGPALEFNENSAGGASSDCLAAVTEGDTHMRTFAGLLYDFQASGDFLLTKASGFTVQARQVSGAPMWPNAAVNSAVATQMGSTRVAMCTAPARLMVNGSSTALADNHMLSLPSGVEIFRRGNVYLVVDPDGDSIRADMNSTWINVSVGLGTWPATVHGLLANANGNVSQLETSGGTVLNEPVSFGDLYDTYGNSWRVAAAASLLSVCGNKIERGNPAKPFSPKDLDPKTRDQARAICIQAVVTPGALLDACTIDVAVLGKQAAAAYVGAPAPVAVGTGT